MPKIVYKTPDIKGKPRQSRDSVAKATRKKVVSRATSKYICGRTIARVFEKFQDREERKHCRKNGSRQ